MKFISNSKEDTIQLGTLIGEKLKPGSVIALQGNLAAGKTCFTKGLALGLGIDEDVTSPTFTLISEYYGRLPLYHMDIYRLDSTEDFIGIGAEDLLYGQGVCAIEWSEKIMEELPDYTISILFEVNNDGSRTITVSNCPFPLPEAKDLMVEK
ncbi:tRNA (adenosine(37)-N6)-threonylcarbamoyltransferase complex ATPase subunit type 1 TsaE [Treponema phagedenis]|uniref:tRNA threonylcarbamoyladenosine biosynthesis protein TsaE n=1 Tax=Treponema phagedenis TaxID=162 RepID=A0A0B7GSJ9_TREPH|nr:tRNA (adenosine(37)-N6)-threonylcarbamoyltransferase complex ATPase subunit type 1 TsaE [Treponema phagedenis]NVP22960.1 tRNA (adenosine(37)-N6)-threonylcarbamoyltransferase complex ATPase subunit type 1 TsaE [Treponema phagedenis]QEJ98245.1 tRNA (adenosine(37)-N6)-threonylcarbamoyltransferase complex ATPase subunit type 1 TsaE [Treponema phagedenis]QEK01007.1 tRNA (adenosine(37)-N6)-threonylcarbamoyltransferase complex ATPase subunit type 1 TsaE [Treponema phagedenis]QEK03756.1 tRNA (adenos